MSISPGVTSAPAASITSVASPVSVSATAATLLPLNATSRLAEIDCAGSTSVPPRTSRSQAGIFLSPWSHVRLDVELSNSGADPRATHCRMEAKEARVCIELPLYVRRQQVPRPQTARPAPAPCHV